MVRTMLTQLTKLAQECEGRYANDAELEFLKDYLEEIDSRIDAYSTIRDNEKEITEQIDVQLKSENPDVFHKCGKDFSSICERDRKHTMRFLATAMLFNEQDKLRGTLLWQSIIMRAFQDENPSNFTYKMMGQVMSKQLKDEEMKLVKPALQLVQTMLG
ncbi:allophycocyanin [Crocosphaera sp. Alani8]|uniref:allophycocyanin n=1 Tax=Crocosphaera sp. Alani8 TaxID=3038952 RepID=UPI00313CD7F5